MAQTRKPPSGSVISREEFDALKRVVEADVLPALKRGEERMDALAKTDNELKEVQMRTNERLARMDTKIDAIGEDTKRLIPFMDQQKEANAEVKTQLGTIITAFRLDEKDGKTKFRDATEFLYRSHTKATIGGVEAVKTFVHSVVVGLLGLFCLGLGYYLK